MEHINLLIALCGLLIFALMLASIVRRYQELMAERRLRIKRILRGGELIKDILNRSAGCPLPAGLEKVLRQDVLARLQMVRQIDARFKGIDGLIAEAQQAGNQLVESQRFVIQDSLHLQKMTHALGELIAFLQQTKLYIPLTEEQTRNFIQLIASRRSECVYRYHLEQAKGLQAEGQVREALSHCNSIQAFLREYGPADSQIEAWYAEAQTMRIALLEARDSSAPAA